jgi:TatD DNase family protein
MTECINLIDSHCHLNRLGKTDTEVDHTINEAKDAGVTTLLTISVGLEEFPTLVSICQRHSHVFASVGVHPSHECNDEVDTDTLISLARQYPKIVVAIGETGLDYHYDDVSPAIQRTRFATHIQAARTLEFPLIIHTREAPEDTLDILRAEKASSGIMHCFTESIDMARQALDLGFYISFSGILTFKNADSIREVAKFVPFERILIETDSPYLAPVPYRGQPNRPAHVTLVNQQLATIKGVSDVECAATTSANFLRLFQGLIPANGKR